MATFTHQFLIEFIEMYKSESCLWQVKSPEYSNRNLRNAAIGRLLRKMKEADPDATHDTVRKKINSFRTVFRKEHRKVLRSRQGGTGRAVHQPTLWYYDLLLFLTDQYDPQRSRARMKAVRGTREEGFHNIKIEEDSDASSFADDGSSSGPGPATSSAVALMKALGHTSKAPPPASSCSTSVGPATGAKRAKQTKRDSGSPDHAPRAWQQNVEMDDDFFFVMGKNWSNKMRNLSRENPLMAKIAEKLIGEIFFEADMGTLTKRSFIVNPMEQEYAITASSL